MLLAVDGTVDRQDDRDLEGAVVAEAGDAVVLAVDRAAAVALVAGEVPREAPSLDDVADPGGGAVAQREAVLGDAAEAHELVADGGGDAGGGVVGVDDQQGAVAGEGVGQPGSGRGRFGLGSMVPASSSRPWRW